MSAFLVVRSTIKDPEKFQAYAQAVGPTLAPFKGEVALRGKAVQALAGEDSHQTVGILKFPDRSAASAWYGSADYQALVPNRDAAADMTVVCYEEPPA